MQILLPSLSNCSIAVIGMGYVGLPLAIEFSRTRLCSRTNQALNRRVIGFDINAGRINDLRDGFDKTCEVSTDDLSGHDNLHFTFDPNELVGADVFIVTVPTPIDHANKPDLSPLSNASTLIGNTLKSRLFKKSTAPLVIFESTVYPGATEEVCVPLIEKHSGLTYNRDFFCGYSPERINPGDKKHRLVDIVKVTSGSTPSSAKWVNSFYESIIKAGTYLASSIIVAEAAKIIENTQRDINIGLMNELAILFNRLEIDTQDVLAAARTKWNFLDFQPGLVGGHCIGVDPYYLTYKAEEAGYHPEIISAGRRINDSMAAWIGNQVVKRMAISSQPLYGANVLVLGLSFKENCPDLRNTKVIDLIHTLREYGVNPHVVDPVVCIDEALTTYGIKVEKSIGSSREYDAIILAVSHNEFRDFSLDYWQEIGSSNCLFFDLKNIIPRALNPMRL